VFGWGAYSAAKLMTNLFIRELASRSAVEAYAFHPGFVRSDSVQGSGPARFLTKGNYGISSEAGAQPLVQLAGAAGIEAPSGTYFHRMKPSAREARQASDGQLGEFVWERTSELVGLPTSI
jgi:NAD(P)-dependent dehydrogenase (short-subunit alcohol dehydrogenase family)